jgi:hypothetical protein
MSRLGGLAALVRRRPATFVFTLVALLCVVSRADGVFSAAR